MFSALLQLGCIVFGSPRGRFLRSLAFFAALTIAATTANASIIVGSSNMAGGGNDPLSEVLNVIDDYNTANDPDLLTSISLFKKTDDDSAFVFDMSNGFMFFTDLNGTTPVTGEGALTSLETAAFKYTGPENVLFYSVKGSSNDGFTLYTVMSGLNPLDTIPGSSNISHLSFWTGPPGIDPFGDPDIPEPSTLALLGLGLVGIAWRRGRSRLASGAA